MNPLGDGQDEGRHDADHDGLEKSAEEDRRKSNGNTHFMLLLETADQPSVAAKAHLHGVYKKRLAHAAA